MIFLYYRSASLINQNSTSNLIDTSETEILLSSDENNLTKQSEIRNFTRKTTAIPQLHHIVNIRIFIFQ